MKIALVNGVLRTMIGALFLINVVVQMPPNQLIAQQMDMNVVMVVVLLNNQMVISGVLKIINGKYFLIYFFLFFKL